MLWFHAGRIFAALFAIAKAVEEVINLFNYLLSYHCIESQFIHFRNLSAFIFQWLFQPIEGPGLLFSSVIIFHRRWDSLDEWSARHKAATYTQDNTNTE
jgi:hypothetical protein